MGFPFVIWYGTSFKFVPWVGVRHSEDETCEKLILQFRNIINLKDFECLGWNIIFEVGIFEISSKLQIIKFVFKTLDFEYFSLQHLILKILR